MLHFLVLLAVSEAFVVEPWLGSNKRCNNPKFWCQSMDTARECGVVEYCNVEWGKVQRTDYIKFGNVLANAKVPANKKVSVPEVAPVKVSLYYESLCPGCRNFIHTQLYPAYEKLSASGILEIQLVPYGNAREQSYGNKWLFTCQHGPSECKGNVIETCALKYANNTASLFMPFIYCIEYFGPTPANAEYCAGQHGLPFASISNCVDHGEGNGLEHQMALKTDALNPPHQYVPWITVNGEHTDSIQSEMQSNALAYICSVYTGTKPAACNQAKDKMMNVCHKN